MIAILPDEILQKILRHSSLSNTNVANFSLSSKKILKTVVLSMLREFLGMCDKNEEYNISSEHMGGNQMDYNIFYRFIIDHGKIKIPTNLNKYPMMYGFQPNSTPTEYKVTDLSGLYKYLHHNVPPYGSFQTMQIYPGEYRDERYIVLSKAVSLLSMLNKIEQYGESSNSNNTVVNSSSGGRQKKNKKAIKEKKVSK